MEKAKIKDSIKRAHDIANLQNQIAERQAIINNYIGFGVLDRGDAIRKITDLRKTDDMVGVAYVAQVTAAPSIPLDNCPDHQLINELQAQIDILQSELTQKLKEEAESYAHP